MKDQSTADCEMVMGFFVRASKEERVEFLAQLDGANMPGLSAFAAFFRGLHDEREALTAQEGAASSLMH